MKQIIGILLINSILFSCTESNSQNQEKFKKVDFKTVNKQNNQDMSKAEATFGAGCFWCVEAVFQQLKGVDTVISAYAGGHVANPTYEQVCSKTTGHAEVCRIVYDPNIISFDELLEVFWQTHDPTTKDQQGNDKGPQYRSVIFYHNEMQKELAEKYKAELNKSGAFKNPIVTEITELNNFYLAENYHQNYYKQNPQNPYCSFVVGPKVEKFKKVFKDKLKK